MRRLIPLVGLITSYLTSAQEISVGAVVDTVYCKDQPNQSYALYLPSYYNNIKEWPAVFIFEPAARGKLPLELYQKAAEELGYILVCSNNSKNGPFNIIFEAQEAMFSDAKQKLSIDPNRIYTSGFSGGARSAIAIAVRTGKVRGVISCAGSFPSNEEYIPDERDAFYFSGIVGDLDMNYHEHGLFRQHLNKMGIDNQLIYFHAGHQWPPVEVYRKSLAWMKLKELEGQNIFFEEYALARFQEARDSIKNSKHAIGHEILAQLKKDIAPAYWISDFEELLVQTEKSKDFKKASKNIEKIASEEQYLFDGFLEGLRWVYFNNSSPEINLDSIKYSFGWWQKQINMLERNFSSKNAEKRLMAHRLIDVIARNSITRVMEVLPLEYYEAAQAYNRIWIMAWPGQPSPYYSMSKIQIHLNDGEEALRYLRIAIESGYQIKYIQLSEFEILSGSEEFQSLLSSN